MIDSAFETVIHAPMVVFGILGHVDRFDPSKLLNRSRPYHFRLLMENTHCCLVNLVGRQYK